MTIKGNFTTLFVICYHFLDALFCASALQVARMYIKLKKSYSVSFDMGQMMATSAPAEKRSDMETSLSESKKRRVTSLLKWTQVYQVDVQRTSQRTVFATLLRASLNNVVVKTVLDIRARLPSGVLQSGVTFTIEELQFLRLQLNSALNQYPSSKFKSDTLFGQRMVVVRSKREPKDKFEDQQIFMIGVIKGDSYAKIDLDHPSVVSFLTVIEDVLYIHKHSKSTDDEHGTADDTDNEMFDKVFGLLMFKLIEPKFENWCLVGQAIHEIWEDVAENVAGAFDENRWMLRVQVNRSLKAFNIDQSKFIDRFTADESSRVLRKCIQNKIFRNEETRNLVWKLGQQFFRPHTTITSLY